MSAEERRARAAARASSMVLRKATLAEHEHDFSPVAGPEAISLLTRLSRESWAATGRDDPGFARGRVHVRFVPRTP